jgi:hypothetical protein
MKEKGAYVFVSCNWKNKNFFKNLLCFILPLIFALGGSYLGIKKANQVNAPTLIVEVEEKTLLRRLYLLTNDNLTLPLSVNIAYKETLQEEIYALISLMKESSPCANQEIYGFIKDEAKLEKFILENRVLSLYFNDEFIVDFIKENKALEALTLSLVQYEDID